jgi:hypothetical protein
LRQEFIIALSSYPDWAIQRAFDQWVKDAKRRPSPGEIVSLAALQVKTITDELSRRERLATPAIGQSRERVSASAAAEIMAKAGFTPKRMDATE